MKREQRKVGAAQLLNELKLEAIYQPGDSHWRDRLQLNAIDKILQYCKYRYWNIADSAIPMQHIMIAKKMPVGSIQEWT